MATATYNIDEDHLIIKYSITTCIQNQNIICPAGIQNSFPTYTFNGFPLLVNRDMSTTFPVVCDFLDVFFAF